MQCVTRPRITELNPHLLCVLCGGYYIDATAIIECLHSFCKSCIVRYLETHKYCPICDVLVHKTKPLQNLRPDTILQSIVYKLVPDLYDKEMRNRRNYYVQVNPNLRPQSAEEKGEITRASQFYSNSDIISFTLEYVNYLSDQHYCFVASNSKRYFQCKASVSIEHLRKLVEAKYTPTMKHEISFFYNEIQLPEHLTLLDIAYISSWKRNGFIRLLYQILEVRKIVVKEDFDPPLPPITSTCALTSPVSEKTTNLFKSTVDVEISTSEPSSVTLSEHTKDHSKVPVVSSASSHLNSPVIDNEKSSEQPSPFPSSSSTTTPSTSSVTVTCSAKSDKITASTLATSITTPICTVSVNGLSSKENEPRKVEITDQNEIETKTESTCVIAECSTTPKALEDAKEQRTEVLADREEKVPLPVKRPLAEVDAKIKVPIAAKPSTNELEVSPSPAKVPKLSTPTQKEKVATKSVPEIRTIISVTSCGTSCSAATVTYSTPSISPMKTSSSKVSISRVDCVQKSSPRPIFTRSEVPMITKSTTRITKTFNRPWNSSTSSGSVPDVIDPKDKPKPMKIIKARNTPRYLGNPASGIRPIFQVTPPTMSPDKSTKLNDTKKPFKNLSVMKIDPQTLSPIVTTTSSMVPTSSGSKKSYPYSPVSSELYTSSGPYTSGSLTTYTSSSGLTSKPGPYVLPNPLLPMNQLMYEMYGNGARTLEYMKAMTTNFCNPAMFHPSLHPPLSSFYNSLQKNAKYDKSSRAVKALEKSPPAIQRMPASNNNNNNNNNNNSNNMKLAISEHSSKKTSTSAKHDNVSNGQLKSKKKTCEVSSFSINNLIPLEMVKHASHLCSADGVNQICDQMPQQNHKKNSEPKETEVSAKVNDVKE